MEDVVSLGEMRKAYRMLVGKSEGRRPIRRQSCGWEVNIKMNLKEIGHQVVDWIQQAQDVMLN